MPYLIMTRGVFMRAWISKQILLFLLPGILLLGGCAICFNC